MSLLTNTTTIQSLDFAGGGIDVDVGYTKGRTEYHRGARFSLPIGSLGFIGFILSESDPQRAAITIMPASYDHYLVLGGFSVSGVPLPPAAALLATALAGASLLRRRIFIRLS